MNYLELLRRQFPGSSKTAHQVKALVTKPYSLDSRGRRQELTPADGPRPPYMGVYTPIHTCSNSNHEDMAS